LTSRTTIHKSVNTGSSRAAVKNKDAPGYQPARERNGGSAAGAPAFPALPAVRGLTGRIKEKGAASRTLTAPSKGACGCASAHQPEKAGFPPPPGCYLPDS